MQSEDDKSGTVANLPHTRAVANRDFHIVAQSLADAWIPVNPVLLEHIKLGLAGDLYHAADPTTLLDDLKGDISLYLIMLARTASKDSISSNRADAITNYIANNGLEGFASLLPSSVRAVSAHDFSAMKTTQALRIHESLRAACISEALAEAQGIDSELAFSVALLRKAGLLLMAWNYPHLFERACSGAASAAERDENLTKLIGFSPKLLAISLARNWGLAEQYRMPLGDQDSLNGERIHNLSLERLSISLEKLCQIGETLAQLSNPNDISIENTDWSKAKNEVLRALGAQGFKNIEARIGKALIYYRSTMPELFREADCIDKNVSYQGEFGQRLLHANTHVKYLSDELQEEMRALYELISPKAVSKSSLQLLISSIVPKAEFRRGCVYLLDPPSGSLIPRVAIGGASLQQFQSFLPGYLTLLENPLSAAFRLGTPLVQEERTASGPQIKFIAAALGESNKIGLLYLEPTAALAAYNQAKALLNFKAIRTALNDCLTLF